MYDEMKMIGKKVVMAYFKTTEPDYFDVVLTPQTCIPEVTCST
jgi:hypothetical protein